MKHRWLIGTGMVLALAAALALIAGGAPASLAENGMIYVDQDAPGPTHDGSSWDFAYTGLQDALADAEAGQQIWVAAGTYKPTDTTDRTISFQMANGVTIYGGFDPSMGATEWEDRDWVLHQTILSGDLNGDDEPDFANNGENSYHVFYHYLLFLDHTAVLDGFTVSGGNADVGGGMYNDLSSPALTNVTFSGNSAWLGAGMYNIYSSSPALTNCSFSQNHASGTESWQGRGGGIYNDESSPSLTGCTFSGNSADVHGGGMYNEEDSSPTLTDCTFTGNSAIWAGGLAGESGGGMYNDDHSSPTLTNCTFTGNSAIFGGGMWNGVSSPTLTNCTFSNNSAYTGGAIFNDQASPALTNCTFAGNSATGIYNSGSSPTLTNCILWGNTPLQIDNDGTGSTPVVTYSDVQGDAPYTGMGNINEDPLFMDAGSGDLHLRPGSPCIDAGTNTPSNLPLYDFEGDPRIIDGDGDGEPVVDMGVDEALWLPVYLPLVLRNH